MKGILFRPEMVQAIISGSKTRSRRVIKPQPLDIITDKTHDNKYNTRHLKGRLCWYAKYEDNPPRGKIITSRYQQGETVYIKEAWAVGLGHIIYKNGVNRRGDSSNLHLIKELEAKSDDWRSPLFMPEWAARHFITITDVRAERLQEIATKDKELMAEGIRLLCYDNNRTDWVGMAIEFANVWNSINKDYPWESNPWVWVYTFRRKDTE